MFIESMVVAVVVVFKGVLLVWFMYRVFTCTPGGVTVGDSSLCCCACCMLSVVNFLCLLIY